jgi:uncharacterized protein YPO0396
MEPIEEKILTAMTMYIKEFYEDKTDLSVNIASLNGFERILIRIEEDDLPRHENRFRVYMDEKITDDLHFLNNALNREQLEIRSKIETLNASLRQLEYNPGTYMRLDVRDANDPQIGDFRRRMSECIDNSFVANVSISEARYKKIEALIKELETEPNWTEKVIDVRRWFTFIARELDATTEESKSSYDDSSGQSGGEKAKLAFTILVASIAYQYDIEP